MGVIDGYLTVDATMWKILFAGLFLLALYFFVRGIFIFRKRAVESKLFVILTVPTFVWTGVLLLGAWQGEDVFVMSWMSVALYAAQTLIPGFLMLHVWSQTSYKPITLSAWVATLIVPVILIMIEVLDTFATVIGLFLYLQPIIALFYFIVVMVRAYLLCFNVFYQMPRHMRRSTTRMLLAISSVVAAAAISQFFDMQDYAGGFLYSIAYTIMLIALDSAFFITNSSNVIVTSRDFVFASLSTIVITVSLKGAILDWNRKTKNGCYPLPSPHYMESYQQYRARILDSCNGTVSPHDNNILTTNVGGKEAHFLFTWHEIGFRGRKFGYLVEISEVTRSYSILRYLEDIALFDTLTGLHNRNAYLDTVKRIGPENMPLLIIIGDVNNLKYTNDTLGHLVGDRLLITVTQSISENAPEGSTAYRIGGDEIVLLMPGGTVRDAESFIDRVTSVLDSVDDPGFGKPGISWGYSVMTSASENYNDVFKMADAIMYEAKKKYKSVSLSGMVPDDRLQQQLQQLPPDLPEGFLPEFKFEDKREKS
jgi:diguanylate cyclase (GGDEF)-like protein